LNERGRKLEAAYNIRIAPNNTTAPVKVDPTHTFSKVSMMLSQSGLTTRVGLRWRAPRLFLVLFSSSCTVGRLNNPMLNAFVLDPLITMLDRQSCCPVPARRLRTGYQVQCPHCMKLITFDSSSEDPNIRLP
jgi:hypothetical protein